LVSDAWEKKKATRNPENFNIKRTRGQDERMVIKE
jgi:hypothetical protein